MKKIIPSLAALLAGLITITVLITLTSDHSSVPLVHFFTKPFSSWWYFGNMLNMAGLMIFAAAGSSFALRSGTFNLGGEAQIYAPALTAAIILTSTIPATSTETAIQWTLALIAAIATGALLGFIPGILKAKWRINEMITSFLLSASLLPAIDFLVSGPLRDQSKNLLATAPIPLMFRIRPFLSPSFFNLSFFIASALAIVLALFLKYTSPGYRLRITGTAPEFARFAGFSVEKASITGMTVSGMCHALTGFFSITGTWYMCHNGFSSGMGWSALAIALIARQNLFAVIPAALLYSWLSTASEAAVLSTRFTFDSTALVQAVIFLVISAQIFPLRLINAFLKQRKP